jgi:hypothetical protein
LARTIMTSTRSYRTFIDISTIVVWIESSKTFAQECTVSRWLTGAPIFTWIQQARIRLCVTMKTCISCVTCTGIRAWVVNARTILTQIRYHGTFVTIGTIRRYKTSITGTIIAWGACWNGTYAVWPTGNIITNTASV